MNLLIADSVPVEGVPGVLTAAPRLRGVGGVVGAGGGAGAGPVLGVQTLEVIAAVLGRTLRGGAAGHRVHCGLVQWCCYIMHGASIGIVERRSGDGA